MRDQDSASEKKIDLVWHICFFLLRYLRWPFKLNANEVKIFEIWATNNIHGKFSPKPIDSKLCFIRQDKAQQSNWISKSNYLCTLNNALCQRIKVNILIRIYIKNASDCMHSNGNSKRISFKENSGHFNVPTILC